MKALTINLPDTIDVDNRQLVMIIASRLYENGKLTLGQAAEVAGLSKRTFMELLGDYGVSVFNHSASDIEGDVSNA